jgi:hypothetical protein
LTSWVSDAATEWGGRPIARSIAEAGPRQRAVLVGKVCGVRVRYQFGHRVEAEFDDGTGLIVLCWVGRDEVPGVLAGAVLLAEGTVLLDRGRLVLLNPLYALDGTPPPAA